MALFPRSIHPKQPNVRPGVTYPTYEAAEQALQEAIVDYRRGDITFARAPDNATLSSQDRTVATVVQRFINENRSGPDALAPKTVIGYRSDLRTTINHPIHGLGSRSIDELTTPMLKVWRDTTLPNAGLSQHTIRAAFRLLTSALSWEVEQGRLTANPGLAVRSRRRSSTTSRKTATTRISVSTWEQEMKLVLAVSNRADRLMMLTLMRSGARFGEVASIDPANVTASGIYISHQWVIDEDKVWRLLPLKTGEERTLMVPTPLLTEVVRWRDHERTAPAPPRKNVLFPYVPSTGARRGVGVWTASDWRRKVLTPAIQESGVSKIRAKDMRMNAASNFHDAGFSDAQVAELLGHAPGSGITKRHYVRATHDVHNVRREAIRQDVSLSPQQRLDALWEAWVGAVGHDPLT